MAVTDFKQIGFNSPRDNDTSVYAADINACYGAIQSMQEALKMETISLENIPLVNKPYYQNKATYDYKYYELPITYKNFISTDLSVKVNGNLKNINNDYKIIQNNAILFNSELESSDIVTVSGTFISESSYRINYLQTQCNNIVNDINKIRDGNITVSTSDKTNKIKAFDGNYYELAQALLQMVYPVGSIYISTQNKNPSTFIGGEWERFAQGRTLIGVADNMPEYNQANKKIVANPQQYAITLTTSQLPSHSHNIPEHIHWLPTRQGINATISTQSNILAFRNSTDFDSNFVTSVSKPKLNATVATGLGDPIDIRQPSITCYMWKRIS